jgi:hypothetical protein
MTSISSSGRTSIPRAQVSAEALSRGRIALLLGITVFLALAAYYFVGIDEGMTSLFGKTMVIHEWVHDSRHFLGFPCH